MDSWIRGLPYNWFKNYLKRRTKRVKIGNIISDDRKIKEKYWQTLQKRTYEMARRLQRKGIPRTTRL